MECVRLDGARALHERTRDDNVVRELIDQIERIKANIRAKVEHPFQVIKRQFDRVKGHLTRAGEEHCATAHAVCTAQPVDGAASFTGSAGTFFPAIGQWLADSRHHFVPKIREAQCRKSGEHQGAVHTNITSDTSKTGRSKRRYFSPHIDPKLDQNRRSSPHE